MKTAPPHFAPANGNSRRFFALGRIGNPHRSVLATVNPVTTLTHRRRA
jgi:hypothetical protein